MITDVRSKQTEVTDRVDQEHRPESSAQLADESSVRYWKVSAGKGGKNWDIFRDRGLIPIGFEEEVQDLRGPNPSSREELNAYLAGTGAWGGKVPAYNAGQYWLFYHEMQPGDWVCGN